MPLVNGCVLPSLVLLYRIRFTFSMILSWLWGFCLSVCFEHVQIQLIRIQLRVPEYGWTTQKVFHLMNFVVNGGNTELA